MIAKLEIKIPFNEWSKERLKTNNKRATSRNKKYGEEGDVFWVDDVKYEICFVTKLPLYFVTEHLWRTEGAKSSDELKKVWIEIHPKRGWIPENMVWYHFFKEVK